MDAALFQVTGVSPFAFKKAPYAAIRKNNN